jgi:PAS domain S-box-containing protein
VTLLVYALFAQGGLVMLGIVIWLGLVRREVTGARELALLAFACAGWITCDLLGLLVADPQSVRWLSLASYPFIAFTSPAWLAFALAYTGRPCQVRSWWFRTLLGLSAVTTVVALTSDLHNWLYLDRRVVAIAEWTSGRPAYGVDVAYGPWFWVHGAASWWMTVAGSMLVVTEHVHAVRATRHMARWIGAAALLPLAVNLVHVFGLVSMAKDLTPLSLGVTVSVASIALFRHRLAEIRPVRRSTLVDALEEAVLVLDSAGRLTDFNPAMRRLSGLTDADLGSPLAARAAGDERLSRLLALHDAAEGARPTLQLVDGGEPRWFEYRSTPLRGPDLDGGGRVILLLDVTEREAALHARRTAEAALRAANDELTTRNRDLDAFAQTVAHDLKSPAGTLRSYVHLLREDGDLPDDMRRASLDAIDAVSAKLARIVDEMLLLASARGQAVTPRPVRMQSVVDEALARLGPMILEHHARIETADAWPDALGHAPWIEEVWVNYVSNAIKYGGRPPHVRLGAGTGPDGQPRFWVQDNGPGIDPADRGRLFVPFTRLRGSGADGHGLGLAIVRQIVDRLGGTCGVEEAEGGGARFYFVLPRMAEKVRRSADGASEPVSVEVAGDGRA